MPKKSVMYKGARYVIAEETIKYDDLYNKAGWKISDVSTDIIEGQTLYSWEGPESSPPVGVEATGKMEKEVGGVKVKAAFKVTYEDASDEDGTKLNPETIEITLESPKGAMVDVNGEINPLEEVISDLTDLFHEKEFEDAILGDVLGSYARQQRRFEKSYSRLKNRWHTFY